MATRLKSLCSNGNPDKYTNCTRVNAMVELTPVLWVGEVQSELRKDVLFISPFGRFGEPFDRKYS